jgi:uncharacterized protein (TIGR03086 family)
VDALAALDNSTAPLLAVAARVQRDQWGAPTPCTEWTVRILMGHLVATMHSYCDLLHNAPADNLFAAMAGQADAAGDDPGAALGSAVTVVRAGFAEPGALDRICHHPIGDISGHDLMGIRISENLVHGWDLATATGVEMVVDDELAARVYERLEPQAAGLAATDFFSAPTTPLPADASRLEQLVHLVGRQLPI